MIERSAQDRKTLWYRFPAHQRLALTDQADPFVIAAVFLAMRDRTDLIVHGTVSPSLLRNLAEFQAAWANWRPERYACIDVLADSESEPASVAPAESALAAFSGGVDSSFTVFRHRADSGVNRRLNLRAAVMVHGFDIPLAQSDVFSRAAAQSERMLDSLGVELIPLATNFRELKLDWKDCFAAAAASCLSLFRNFYGTGLLGSSEPYSRLVLPWGSNPITDHLLSSDSFRIIHDGAAYTRTEKIREIACWPEAMCHLRVCWQGEMLDRNCGICEKCIRTILNFRLSGVSLPASFDRDVTDAAIVKISSLNEAQLSELEQIVGAARKASLQGSWVSALEKCIRRNYRRQWLRRFFPGETIENLLSVLPWRVRTLLLNRKTGGASKGGSKGAARNHRTTEAVK